MSVQIQRSRLIFKVVIIGRDLPLQTGFLTRVSGNNISTQLFNTIGLSLGIARFEEEDEFSVVLQLWTIPFIERVEGLTKSFIKGYRAVIVVVRPDELHEVPRMLQNMSIDVNKNIYIVLVGNITSISHASEELTSILEESQIIPITHPIDVIGLLSQELLKRERKEKSQLTILSLDEIACPAFELPLPDNPEAQCSEEDIDSIRSILIDQGLGVSGETCTVEMNEGIASVSLRTGSVRLQPAICDSCFHDCKRSANVCIIAVDSGWSSQDLSQKALLVTAKALSLAERNLPEHVIAQLQRASSCSKYELNPEIESTTMKKFETNIEKSLPRKSLLDIAEERVRNGKLSKSIYDMLKRSLLNLKES